MNAKLQEPGQTHKVRSEETTASAAPNSTAFARWWAEYQEQMGTAERVVVSGNELNSARAIPGKLLAK